MQLQTYAKIGIVVGIASLVILTPILFLGYYIQMEHEFDRFFIDTKKHLQKMKTLDSYRNFVERYPEAIIHEREYRGEPGIELYAFDNIVGSRLELRISYEPHDERYYERADCDVEDRQYRDKLDSMPGTELKIPAILYKEGHAREQFVAEFIKHTNCLELGNQEKTTEAIPTKLDETTKSTHYIAIPRGSSVPGCEETNECFAPSALTVKAGSVIEWQNFDDAAHTITSGTPDDGPDDLFDSGLFMSQESFRTVLTNPGTYDYFCMVHPWQTGVISVEVIPENE